MIEPSAPRQEKPRPPEEPQAQPPVDQPLREISDEDLQKTLEAHAVWVESNTNKKWRLACEDNKKDYVKGRADLAFYNLEGRVLEQKDLHDADLHQAVLQDAKLKQTNFGGADLREALLHKADFRESILWDADLSGTRGLLAGQLAGANVSGTKLPEEIGKFDGLKQVDELAKAGKRLFFSMLLGCVYAWLTMATTTDVRLVTNSSSTPLPIIQAPVPIADFFVWGPLVLFSLFVWFHLYLQEMWRGLSKLPAIFPDGKALDEKASPWLLTGLVQAHFKLLRNYRPPLSKIKVGLSIFLAWWVVPTTFAGFWLRYLPRHDWWGTSLHLVLLVLSILSAIRFQHLAKLTLRGEQREPLNFTETWREVITYTQTVKRGWKLTACGLAILTFTVVVSDGAINGEMGVSQQILTLGPSGIKDCEVSADSIRFIESPHVIAPFTRSSSYTDIYRAIVPFVLPYIGARAFADLTETNVSTKPENWFVRNDKTEFLDVVQGAQLSGVDLRNASADHAFLANTDFRFANLQNASLIGANLQNANLYKANLQNANLTGANLQNAILVWANLKGANLEKTNLKGANLSLVSGVTDKEIKNKACHYEKTKFP